MHFGTPWNMAKRAWSKRRIRVWSLCLLAPLGWLVLAILFPQYSLPTNTDAGISPILMFCLFALALICEYIDSSLGMGYGTTLTPILLVLGFPPLALVPCVLFSELLSGLFAAALHHKDGNIDWRHDEQARSAAKWLGGLSVLGAGVAVCFAFHIPTLWLKGIIAVIVFAAGLVTLLSTGRTIRYRPIHILLLGAIASFNKGLSGGGYGPLVTSGQVVSGIPAKKAVAVTSLAESLTCLVALLAYVFGSGSMQWPLAVPLAAGALMSVPLATLTVRGISETTIRLGIGALSCLLGGMALWKAL